MKKLIAVAFVLGLCASTYGQGTATKFMLFDTAILGSMQSDETAVTADPGALGDVGYWMFQAYGSASLGNDKGEIYLAHVGFGYFVYDGLSINLEAVGGGFRASDRGLDDGHTSGAIGLDLLFRWHFYRDDRWSVYLDCGGGLLQADTSFPANGTHFNFTPQAGIGVTCRFTDHMYVMTGTRWHHVSNAGKNSSNENPGYDAPMIYGGILFAF